MRVATPGCSIMLRKGTRPDRGRRSSGRSSRPGRPAEGSGLDQLLNCDIVGEQFGGQLNVISQTDAFFTEFLIPLSQEMEASYGGQQ